MAAFVAKEAAAFDLGLGFQTVATVSLPTLPSDGVAWHGMPNERRESCIARWSSVNQNICPIFP